MKSSLLPSVPSIGVQKNDSATNPRRGLLSFANEWMSQGGRQLGRNLFQQIYQRFGGHTWYMQYILNRLYEQPQPTIDEKLIEECISDIIHSEIDSYQQLYGMLTENQSSLLRAIAREKIVTAINSSAFIKNMA